MLRNSSWTRVAAGVLALAGCPATWEQRAMSAALAGGPLALLTADAAALMYGLDGFATVSNLTLALPLGGHARRLTDVSVLWTRGLDESDRHVINSIPVTTLPLTLVHLRATGRQAEKALDSALRQRRSPVWLRSEFENVVEVWWRDLDRMDEVVADLKLAFSRAARLSDQPHVANSATSG